MTCFLYNSEEIMRYPLLKNIVFNYYSLNIVHDEVLSPDQGLSNIFPSSGRIDTAVWMHYMDAN